MELHFGTYRELAEKDQVEIKGLIIKGNEANASLVKKNLWNLNLANASVKVDSHSY